MTCKWLIIMVSNWDDPPRTGSIPSHSPLCFFFQRGGGDLVTPRVSRHGRCECSQKRALALAGGPCLIERDAYSLHLGACLAAWGVIRLMEEIRHQLIWQTSHYIWQTSHYLQGFRFHTVQDF